MALYNSEMSLQAIGEELGLNPIKVRKLLSKASVTSYLPYKKGVYFPSTAEKEKISVGAERQRRYRVMKRWRSDPTEENFWGVVVGYAGVKFKTYSGLSFSYEVRKGRNGEYTKELWIDRREKSKSLAWSSVLLAVKNIKKVDKIYIKEIKTVYEKKLGTKHRGTLRALGSREQATADEMPGKWICYKNAWVQKLKAKSL